MLYTPLLPEAASGTLEPRHVVVPLRLMCPHAELLLGRATAVDAERAHASPSRPRTARSRSRYEQLVVALGAVPRTLPDPGLAEHGLGFKDLADAIALRNHVLRELEAADAASRPDEAGAAPRASSSSAPATRASRRSPSSPTSSATPLRYYPRLRDVPQRWVLVDAAPKILPRSRRGSASTRRASSRGAASSIHVGTTLESDDGRERRALGRRRASRTARSSGRPACAPNPLLGALGLPLDERGRVLVDELLRVEGHDRRLGARRLRARAEPRARRARSTRRPASTRCARPAASRRTSPATPKPYRYRMLGQVATLGRYKGIADVLGLRLRGFPGWFVTRTYHLYQLPLLTRKLRVVADWTTSLFFRRDIVELSELGHPQRLD